MNNKALAMVIWLLVAHSIGAMVEPVEAASARGGASDDFSIESISLGNQTVMPSQWTNPDGMTLDYVIAGESIEISVEVSRGCLLYTSPSPRDLSTSRMPSSA